MIEKLLKTIGISFIATVIIFLTTTLGANATDIVTSSGVWYRDGNAMLTNPAGLDLGSPGNEVGDIYAGSLFITSLSLTGNINMPDDIALILGTDDDVRILYETADPNSHNVIMTLPEGDATNSTNFVIGDASILNTDLGVHDGNTEPGMVWYDDAATEWADFRYDGNDFAFDSSKRVSFSVDVSMKDNAQFRLEDSTAGGYSYLGTISTRGGGQYRADEGGYTFTGDSDGNGNNCHTFGSGSSFAQDFDCDTYHADPYWRFMSNTAPDTDNQQFLALYHNKTDGVIESLTGDIVLDPIGGFVDVDGGVVESVSAVQSLDAGDQVALTDGAIRFAGNAGAVTLTSTPHLPDGTYDNECHTLWGTNDTNTLTLQDESVLAGSGVHLGGNVNFVMGNGANIEVCWNATNSDWWAKGTRVIN